MDSGPHGTAIKRKHAILHRDSTHRTEPCLRYSVLMLHFHTNQVEHRRNADLDEVLAIFLEAIGETQLTQAFLALVELALHQSYCGGQLSHAVVVYVAYAY